jgi:hypothetical protein
MHTHARLPASNPFLAALSDLAIGAFFFAMRSCEYLKVPTRGKTKLLRIHNIRFYDGTKIEVPHSTPDLSLRAHFVSITFESQKTAQKNQTRTQRRTNNPILCPVLVWARIVTRILSSPHTSSQSPVNFYHDPSQPIPKRSRSITSTSLKLFLRTTARILGQAKTGYPPDYVGTHSIRSGAAMALFLANEPVVNIQLLGRWSSDAFMDYIRPQEMEWTTGMSLSMTSSTSFFHAPDALGPSPPLAHTPLTLTTDSTPSRTPASTPRLHTNTPARPSTLSFTGSNALIPQINLD